MDHDALTPRPNNWFSSRVEYSGWANAEFENPPGSVEGPATVAYDESGEMQGEVEVEKITTPVDLRFGSVQFFSGAQPTTDGTRTTLAVGPTQNRCLRLTIETDEGLLQASEKILYSTREHFGGPSGSRFWLRFHPIRAHFSVKKAGPAEYWALPLTNFVSDFVLNHPQLDRHVLRIFPTPTMPDDLPKDDAALGMLHANARNRLITFEIDGAIGFIEPMPEYKEARDNLAAGRRERVVTALMVGAIGPRCKDFTNLKDAFPIDILLLLELAAGCKVGAPWVEFRGADGRLVSRNHTRFGSGPYAQGRAAMLEGLWGGTGHLISRYFASSLYAAPSMRIALHQCFRGQARGGSIEDWFASISRGLESLCKHFGLGDQDLLKSLPPTHQQAVRQAIDSARDTIRSIAAAEPDAFHKGTLERIAARAANAANKDVAFGLAVVALLRSLGLFDADIITAHYAGHPRADGIATWAGVLSKYRGAVIHEGFFDVGTSSHDLQDVLRVTMHLHDVLLRIIFRLVQYDHVYQPSVALIHTERKPDWVTPTTPATELGY